MGEPLACVVLAAGEGTRMKSSFPKVLHPLCGAPMLRHVLQPVRELGPKRTVVIVPPGADAVRELCRQHGAEPVEQTQRLGTGHAAAQARVALADFDGPVLVTAGDAPLLRTETLRALVAAHRNAGAGATILSAICADPTGYGRVVRSADGRVQAIVEHRDADEPTRAIREINTSIYVFDCRRLFAALTQVRNDNAQGEYYLTDVVAILIREGAPVTAVVADDPAEPLGVNDRAQLAQADRVLRDRIRRGHLLAGVTLVDPEAAYIDCEVLIGPDTTIWPGVCLLGGTRVGAGCTVGPQVTIEDSEIGDESRILHGSLIRGSTIGRRVSVGPFAHVRGGSELEEGAEVGSYLEVNRSRMGAGTKAKHFGYLGDTHVGARANIGAGTVTCNYDGRRKHRTVIEDGAFIGSNASIVAPVTIGREAYVAAGSTINQDVPAGALGIGRGHQRNIEGWADRQRQARSDA